MNSEKRKEFCEWYKAEKSKGLPFDFQKELVPYCISDVDILRRCWLMFRSLFMDITGKDIGQEGVGSKEFKEGGADEELLTRKVGIDPLNSV
ncbi:hypothetical protein HOLleu_04917 [Holothuria leucospilota]|uniref:Uncharacterized protein n=1 Tax=Holothuria leucospilota TaxID=206669 RepID=A0A9Q1CKU1_HOLLE|nr:hypothetical protein HOLleu_04917 [Holothuria leucospilota]